MNRGTAIVAGYAMGLLALTGTQAAGIDVASAYPVKPVRVVLSVPAGGTPDVLARTVTEFLPAVLHWSRSMTRTYSMIGRIGSCMP